MDKSLKSPGLRAPDDAFHATFELKLQPVFYRSPFNRHADLYPPYGAKIARLEKMLRFMS
jgi:hypothetical protein